MNKYLLFTLEYPPFKGGVASYYENLVKHFPTEISVLNNNDDKLISKNLPFLKWLPAIKQLKSKIKKEGFSYIIVGNILPLGTVCYLLSKFLKFKYAIILHGTDIAYAQKKSRKKKLAKKILKQADKIICNSSFTFEFTKNNFEVEISSKAIVVNPGINPEIKIDQAIKNNLIQKYKLEDKIVLLTISRLIKRKGADKIIEALPEVIKRFENLEYFIVGTGPDEEYLREIKNSFVSLKNKVHFLGQVSEEEKWAWLDICDLFALPTRTEEGNLEGFGIVYLEANLMGKAVLAGKSGGVEDAVEDKINGILIDPSNVMEIADAIIELVHSQAFRQTLGEQGMTRAMENFSWKKQIEKIYDFLNKPTPRPSEKGNKKFPLEES